MNAPTAKPTVIRPGLLETLRRLATTVLTIFQNRWELLVVELQEQYTRFCRALLWTVAVVALGLFTLAMVTLTGVVIVWNQFGMNGLLWVSGAGLFGTLLAYWRLRVRLKNWPLLPNTLDELKRDIECLKRKP